MPLSLPQEILNEIIAHLRGEERNLQSLSLTEKRFTEECRRHLFWSIHIDSEKKLYRWYDTIPPASGLSRYVHLLVIDARLPAWSNSRLVLQDGLARLHSFTKVEHLSICTLELNRFSGQDLERCFGHFSTVRSVSIQHSGYVKALPDFLALFPLLETTIIISPKICINSRSRGVRSTNFAGRGDLVITHATIGAGVSRIVDLLSSLTWPATRYRRLGMGSVVLGDLSTLEIFLRACGSSVEVVQLINCLFLPGLRFPDDLLSPLTGLRDITLSLRYLDDHHGSPAILSSIASTKVDSVTLIFLGFPNSTALKNIRSGWTEIEDTLCRLSELKKRAGCGGEVVLNVHFDNGTLANQVLEFAERGEFFSRFQEVGVVNVHTRPMREDHAVLMMMPEEFR